jgi:hypothetical protein
VLSEFQFREILLVPGRTRDISRSACSDACAPITKSARRRLGSPGPDLRRWTAYRAKRLPASTHTDSSNRRSTVMPVSERKRLRKASVAGTRATQRTQPGRSIKHQDFLHYEGVGEALAPQIRWTISQRECWYRSLFSLARFFLITQTSNPGIDLSLRVERRESTDIFSKGFFSGRAGRIIVQSSCTTNSPRSPSFKPRRRRISRGTVI